MNENSNNFNYTYSSAEQEEIKRIREKYSLSLQKDDKMERLRRLDESVERPGTIISLIIGIVSCLVLGVGMCCTMVWTDFFVLGVIVGIIGIAGIIMAYPVYVRITKKQREKLAPEILRLSEELMK